MMPQYLNFQDMINGGGAGTSGNQFQGGGLLSQFANAFFKPMGSGMEARPQARPDGLLSQAPMPMGAQPMPPQPMQYSGRGNGGMPEFGLPVVTEQMPSQQPNVPFGGYDMNYNPEPPQYSGRGSVGMPMPPYVQMTPNPKETAGLVEYLRRLGVQGY